jgi:DMSO/TMAO reductase YedYZ molybdopterin-dependent catalytic subunit
LETPIELKSWRLRVYVEDQLVHTLPIESLRALERTSTSSEFYCIEGWSAPISYAGVRFSEFIKTYALNPEAYRYVALETPDGEYYVSVDMPSMLHEQTLLAYEMNEKTLKPENGFPLRLIIPIKYGIKSLKRIGAIRLSNTRPKDYWAEQGYDWYSGL